MKINKKFLGCFMAVATGLYALSAYTADAADAADSTVTDTSVMNVVLPTSDAIDFCVDPYGLSVMESEMSLQELMENAPGLVTSSAAVIQNKGSAGVTISAEAYVTSTVDIKLAKTRAEAKSGNADLYLLISPAENIMGWNPVPVTEFSGDGSVVSGSAFQFYLESGTTGTNTTYSFMIDGYANPDSEIWEQIHKQQASLQISMKFTLEYDKNPEESSSEQPSSSTEEATTVTGGGTETTTSPDDPTKPVEEETTKDPLTHVVCNPDGTCTITIQKTKLNGKVPNMVTILYQGMWYDLYKFAYYEDIVESGSVYIISMSDFDMDFMDGEYPLQILDENNNVIYEDLSIIFK